MATPLLPDNMQFSVNSGQMTLTYTAPTYTGHSGVNIYKNGAIKESLYTGTTWYDPKWTEDTVYQIVSENDSGETTSSEILVFPYYPNEYPAAQYYRDAFRLGSYRVGRAVLGPGNHQQALKFKIRHEYELERINGGLLSDVAYTEAGPLTKEHFQYSRMPLIHIACENSPYNYADHAEDEYEHRFTVSVFGDGRDVWVMLRDIETILDKLAWINAREYHWDTVAGAYDTVTQQVTWPLPDSVFRVELGGRNIHLVTGSITFMVRARRAWRDD